MKQIILVVALAMSGAIAAPAGVDAAQAGASSAFLLHAAAAVELSSSDDRGEVIAPPSDIDPGMVFDPPWTAAKMPIIHPPSSGMIPSR
jgi:hypothetical protein